MSARFWTRKGDIEEEEEAGDDWEADSRFDFEEDENRDGMDWLLRLEENSKIKHQHRKHENVLFGELLLSPDGLQVLVDSGTLLQEEKDALLNSGLSPDDYCFATLEWASIYIINAFKKGILGSAPNPMSMSAVQCGLGENLWQK